MKAFVFSAHLFNIHKVNFIYFSIFIVMCNENIFFINIYFSIVRGSVYGIQECDVEGLFHHDFLVPSLQHERKLIFV